MGVKTKLIVAYESESTGTLRVTPEDIGGLLAKVPDSELHRVFVAVVSESQYLTDERRHFLGCEMSDTANRLFLKECE